MPNTGNAPPKGSPVQIEDCTAGTKGGTLLTESDGTFKISFTNEGNVVADVVRFRVQYGNEDLAIRDVGEFSPGVTIVHKFRDRGDNVVSSPLLAPAKLNCSVVAVHFKDDTEWTLNGALQNQAASVAGVGFLGIVLKDTETGPTIDFLIPGGPGRVAGLMQADLIETVDEQRVATAAEATRLISLSAPGTKLKIVVKRAGQDVSVTAVVAKRPSDSRADQLNSTT